ncbi:microsomal signal peptidase 12 kDa subunit [Apiospora arundinis]
MAEQILDQVRDLVDGQIDFKGQNLAEIISTLMLSLVGAIAFFVGYLLQDIALALKLGLAGTVVTFLVVVPPWPFFNRNPRQVAACGRRSSSRAPEYSGG